MADSLENYTNAIVGATITVSGLLFIVWRFVIGAVDRAAKKEAEEVAKQALIERDLALTNQRIETCEANHNDCTDKMHKSVELLHSKIDIVTTDVAKIKGILGERKN